MLTALIALSVTTARQDPAFVHSTTSECTQKNIGGFTVYISPAAIDDKEALDPALRVLEEKIKEINRIVPLKALTKLRTVKIWLEHSNPNNPGAVYHPSASWLKQNGYNTDKERSVELGNLRNLVDWTERVQPMMLLHEMAHAYHHQVIGYGDERVRTAFNKSIESKIYEEVTHVVGRMQKHYGTNNVMEYFAEASEAYFGYNDFFPFNRWQLQQHDPLVYNALSDIWGAPRGQSLTLGSAASEDVRRLLGR